MIIGSAVCFSNGFAGNLPARLHYNGNIARDLQRLAIENTSSNICFKWKLILIYLTELFNILYDTWIQIFQTIYKYLTLANLLVRWNSFTKLEICYNNLKIFSQFYPPSTVIPHIHITLFMTFKSNHLFIISSNAHPYVLNVYYNNNNVLLYIIIIVYK